MARDNFTAGATFSLLCRGPCRVIKSLNDYVCLVEDLRNGSLDEVHGTRLKFYKDSSVHIDAIMSPILSSETGISVQRLMKLGDSPKSLMVQIRSKGLYDSKYQLKLLK